MGQDAEGVWQRTLVTFLKTNNISYAYRSWNQEKSNKILLRSDASTPPPRCRVYTIERRRSAINIAPFSLKLYDTP